MLVEIKTRSNVDRALATYKREVPAEVIPRALNVMARRVQKALVSSYDAHFNVKTGATRTGIRVRRATARRPIAYVVVGGKRGLARWLDRGTNERYQPLASGGLRYVGAVEVHRVDREGAGAWARGRGDCRRGLRQAGVGEVGGEGVQGSVGRGASVMASAAEIAVELRAKADQLLTELDRAGRKSKKFGDDTAAAGRRAKQAAKQTDALTTSVGGLDKRLGRLIAAGGFLILARQLNSFIRSHTANSAKIVEAADTVDLTIEQYTALGRTFEDDGVSIDKMTQGIIRLIRRTARATQGAKEYSDALRSIGLNEREFFKLSTIDKVYQFADAIENTNDHTTRLNAITRLWGLTTAQANLILSRGSQYIKDQTERQLQLGVVTDENARANKALEQAFIDVGYILDGALKNALGENADALREMVTDFGERLPEALSTAIWWVEALVGNLDKLLFAWAAIKTGGLIQFLSSIGWLRTAVGAAAGSALAAPVAGGLLGTVGGAALLAGEGSARTTQNVLGMSDRAIAELSARQLAQIHEDLIAISEKFGFGPDLIAALNRVNEARLQTPQARAAMGLDLDEPFVPHADPEELREQIAKVLEAGEKALDDYFEALVERQVFEAEHAAETERLNKKEQETIAKVLEAGEKGLDEYYNRLVDRNVFFQEFEAAGREEHARELLELDRQRYRKEIELYRQNVRILTDVVNKAFNGIFDSLIDGSKSVMDAILQTFVDLGKQLLQQGVRDFLVKEFAGSAPAPPARAFGGVASGMTLVGETGPELVRFPVGSRVFSSGATEQMMGGGMTLNVDARGAIDPAGVYAAVQAAVNEMLPGIERRMAFDAGRRGFQREMMGA